MKTMSSVLTRRDRCYVIGRRMAKLTPNQASEAWYKLAEKIEAMGSMDVPKFGDLLASIHAAHLWQTNYIPNSLRNYVVAEAKKVGLIP